MFQGSVTEHEELPATIMGAGSILCYLIVNFMLFDSKFGSLLD